MQEDQLADLTRVSEAAMRAVHGSARHPGPRGQPLLVVPGSVCDGTTVDARLHEASMDRSLVIRGDAVNRFGPDGT